MSAEPNRRGRPGYDQNAVLAIAVEAFNEFGYEATSMGVLATRLGISKSAIYHHVQSKETLLQLATERALGGLEHVLAESEKLSGIAQLEFVLRGTVRVLIAQLPYVTLLLRLRGNTDMERQALARRRSIDRAVAAIVGQAQAEGSLKTGLDASTASRLLFGTVNSLLEWYKPGGPLGKKELEDALVSLLFAGLKA